MYMHEGFTEIGPNRESEWQYEDGSRHADARRRLYRFAVPPRNLWQEMAQSLEIGESDQILDIGTGNGEFVDLLDLKVKAQHGDSFQGSILGIDKYPTNYMPAWQERSRRDPISNVAFTRGDIEELYFPSDSIDTISILFVLYHVDNPLSSLTKIKEVLKPGGQLLVATRGMKNQYRMWEFGRKIADRLGTTPPKSFYRRFDIQKGYDVLDSMFEIVSAPDPQDSHLLIPVDLEHPGDNKGWLEYRDALLGLVDLMRDKQTGSKTLEQKAIEIIDSEIKDEFFAEANGIQSENNSTFIDRVQQAYFICRNTK